MRDLQDLLKVYLALTFLLTASIAQYPSQEERYPDSAPESLIPSVPWPEWLPSDLSSIPGNLPRPGVWEPPPQNPAGLGGAGNPPPPQPQGGGSAGMLGAIGKLFGGPAPPANYYPVRGAGGMPPGGPPSSVATGMRSFPRGDPRNCIDKDDLHIMQVVPGLGWDNLRNVETGMVTSFSYSQCKVTYDRAYLIPDQTFAVPVKSSIVERNSEFIENWDAYKSVTSRSINSGFDFFGKIGGTFSEEFVSVKSRMFNEKAVSMRVELRHRFHSIKQLPDSKLHPSFKNRVLDIMSLLKSDDPLSADYATQLLVRDYGTHYLTSVDAGAALVQQDNLKSTIKSEYSGRTNAITAAGGLQFFKFLSAKGGYSSSNGQTDLTAYRNHITSSRVMSYGGPPYRMGMDLTEWETNLRNNLVAVDRTGRPLHSVITTENLKPEVVSAVEVGMLKNLIQSVVNRYYAFNTHLGCTDVNAPNFDYQANSQYPGACQAATRNYTFGGVFQTCSYISNSNGLCSSLVQKNPITGAYSCPSGYEAVLLLSSTAQRPKTDKTCKRVKKCSFFVFNCRKQNKCNYFQTTEKAKHQTFWCAQKKKNQPPHTGYLFGGIYSKDMNNPITRAKNCPNHFTSMKIGSHAKICLSEDYELGQKFSLPFGGFFSCKSGNKLAVNNTSDFLNNPRDWLMKCPEGFTQHLALTDNNCRVNFCVKAGVLLRALDLDIVLPPFEPRPALKENSTIELYEGVDPNAMGGLYSYSSSYPEGYSQGLSSNISRLMSSDNGNGGLSAVYQRRSFPLVAIAVLTMLGRKWVI